MSRASVNLSSMSTSNYDGPRNGDYVRYVEELLRSSPLYRGSVASMLANAPRNFADAVHTPGAQPASVLERLREQAQSAAGRAQQVAQAARSESVPNEKAPRGRRRPRMELAVEQAARQEALKLAAEKKAVAPPWWRITPGRILFALILVGISIALPGIGAMLLLFTIINAVRSAMQSAGKTD
jgi:hypothetical protein